MRKKADIVIWSAYFDSTKTRADGRKISKRLAVPSPKSIEIVNAVEKIGLTYEFISDAKYPKTPWLKTGFLLVNKLKTKSQTIQKIAIQLLQIRRKK